MATARDVLTPDSLQLIQRIAAAGSFAAAARDLGLVPSALSYRVRQIEDALDVLLFDRSARTAVLTEAGHELLREGARLLQDIDAVANRVRRVATGWEPQLTLAVDSVIDRATVMELCEAFFALKPPTRLKLRDETLSGTLEALTSGQADLAIGVSPDAAHSATVGLQVHTLGSQRFVYAVAPHHPLAQLEEPLSDAVLQQHRGVAIADSVQRGGGITVGLLGGQDVFTVPSMAAKLDSQLRGLGGGSLPESIARPYIDAGHLVERRLERHRPLISLGFAWRKPTRGKPGRALQWWIDQLDRPATRSALLGERRLQATPTGSGQGSGQGRTGARKTAPRRPSR